MLVLIICWKADQNQAKSGMEGREVIAWPFEADRITSHLQALKYCYLI